MLYWTGHLYTFPHMLGISEGFPFLFGVILYFYFKIVFRNYKIRPPDILHILPFLLFTMIMLPRYFSGADVKMLWMTGNQTPPVFEWLVSFKTIRVIPWPWIKIIHMTIYLVLILVDFLALSKTDPRVRKWFSWLVGLFAGFIASYASYFILVKFSFFNNEWDYMISFSMMFFIYFIAWFGYLQPAIFSGFSLQESIREPSRYRNSPVSAEVSSEILCTLEKIMNEDKLYRENDLRLDKLAMAVGTSRHHLSQVINSHTGSGFFEYINSLRIREARDLLKSKSKEELNIIEIAYAVGFNNKVSFNTTFKKLTGITPSEFRRQHAEAKSNQ